jgi:hypothetical protein
MIGASLYFFVFVMIGKSDYIRFCGKPSLQDFFI